MQFHHGSLILSCISKRSDREPHLKRTEKKGNGTDIYVQYTCDIYQTVLLVSVRIYNGIDSTLVKREKEKHPVSLGRISLELKLHNRRI